MDAQSSGEPLAGLSSLIGSASIVAGWGAVSTLMVICNDNGGCTEFQRPHYNFRGIYRPMGNSAVLLKILTNEDVTSVEIKNHEPLIFAASAGGALIIQ